MRWYSLMIALTVFSSASGLADSCRATETVKVGKAFDIAFPFTVLDIGISTGTFEKEGLQIDSTTFGGDAKLQQALTAGSVDIGLGSGPALAFIAKGVPALAVGALTNAPNIMALIVSDHGGVKTIADLNGRTIAVSTVGSLSEWMVEEISRRQGWGPAGIRTAAIGDLPGQLAALQTGQVDGIAADISLGLRLQQQNAGHILVHLGEIVQQFPLQVIFATDTDMQKEPNMIRQFLSAWYETVAYMRRNKAETIRIAAPIIRATPEITENVYDTVMPDLSSDGRFESNALALLAQSFVDLKQLPAAPDMQKLVTEAYLPNGH
jgi:NitT/TauT family transport system substrate-binding protein